MTNKATCEPMDDTSSRPPLQAGVPPLAGPSWFEWEVVVLALLVFGAYVLRITDLSIRGEESRWATIAVEMIHTGDWIVPRQQGEPFLSRPPLGSWLIAGAS